jgi:CDP-paratose 2-epimerase
MNYKTILITGGAGFVGSNLAILLKSAYPSSRVISLDNLKRRGSELNLNRLKNSGVEFLHGDIRIKEDLLQLPKIDLILECSAEPSVLAGIGSSPDYLIQTNLFGTINCLELARRDNSDFIFLSTSRVYPIQTINSLKFIENDTRFELTDHQNIPGASSKGYSEDFPLNGTRSLYGATKLSSENMILEYLENYQLKGVINRCGVITGPWQMGKVDQGVVVFWAANHIYQKPLSYFGYGGEGKQVRDILHIQDLFNLIQIQMQNLNRINGKIFNVGGGRDCSVSLNELTTLCSNYSKNTVPIHKVNEDRVADIRIYITDNQLVEDTLKWKPKFTPSQIMEEIIKWISDNKEVLKPIFG